MTNATIPEGYQNIIEAMFCCVEDQTAAKTMTVAQVLDYMSDSNWDDLIDFLDDPRVFQQPGDNATREGIIEIANTYPHYSFAEECAAGEAEAQAFLAEFN